MYLGNVFHAKHKNVGFSKPDVLSGRWRQTGVARWNWLLLSYSRPSPRPNSLPVSKTKGELFTQSNNDVTISKTTEQRDWEGEKEWKNKNDQGIAGDSIKLPHTVLLTVAKKVRNYLVLAASRNISLLTHFLINTSRTTYFSFFSLPVCYDLWNGY